ncbi:MAG: site-specific integrase [Verrucomicrobiales bacterium]|nr:site-specific integrase [Verrucomicrobiales bacterium]
MARENVRKNPFSKTDFRYWEDKVKLPRKKEGESVYESNTFTVRIQHSGHRETFSTGESSKRAAAKKALEIYLTIRGAGWDEARLRHKGVMQKMANLTVGEFLDEVGKVTALPRRTFETYAGKLRSIVDGIVKIKMPEGMNRRDYYNGGAEEWRRRIGEVKLSKITPEKVNRWKLEYLAKASSDPRDKQAKRRSVNSLIRNSKTLFSQRHLDFLTHLELPDPLPFTGVRYEPEGSMRYYSQCEPGELMEAACRDLFNADASNEVAIYKGKPLHPMMPRAKEIAESQASSKREAFKIFLLALSLGLRRNEIDKLQWKQFLWSKGAVRIDVTDCFEPKANSGGDVPLDPEILQFFRERKEEADDRFVIEGVEPILDSPQRHYRADKHFKTLSKWLGENGIESRNKIHALRKEYGTIICAQAGIHAASVLLRHSDIRITAAHYVDNRKRVTSGLGEVLQGINS